MTRPPATGSAKKQRASIRDVARLAGVSAMTVSRVLSETNSGLVRSETVKAVMRAIERLGYVPVQTALQNRPSRRHVLGLVVRYPAMVARPLWQRTLVGMQERCSHHGYDLLLISRDAPKWAAKRPEIVYLDGRCDGLIMFEDADMLPLVRKLRKRNLPIVAMYGKTPTVEASVTVDNTDGISAAVRHLVSLGHRRIAHLAGPETSADARERRAAFAAAMADAGVDQWAGRIRRAAWGADLATEDFSDLLAWQPTAVCCANDYQAASLIEFATRRGVLVPGDLSIVGFDGLPFASMLNLTTVEVPCEEVGRQAVDALVGIVETGRPPQRNVMLAVALAVRASTTPPRSR
ncbi:MAG TPA: LacI family DNA-binding transcriptional regulator [Planctomycetota bacterium]|nr:LacI family DNA-binding transcriptional regulator [Planctomycetota bacterium]